MQDIIVLDNDTRGQIDLIKFEDGYLITRIFVQNTHRGQGVGQALLDKVKREADLETVPLYLEINPYGEMTYRQLESWYVQNGFRKENIWLDADYVEVFIRRPHQ